MQAPGVLVPRPGIEPVSPALEGRVLTTGQPGSPLENLISLRRQYLPNLSMTQCNPCQNPNWLLCRNLQADPNVHMSPE